MGENQKMSLRWRMGAIVSLFALVLIIWDTIDFMTGNKLPQYIIIIGLLLGALGLFLMRTRQGLPRS